MRDLVRSSSDLLAEKYRAGVGDYSHRASAHWETAQTMSAQATRHTPEGVTTYWESPQALRRWSHENELAHQCQQASYDCHRYWYRASVKAHAHRCLCLLRNTITHRDTTAPARTLAQVASDYAQNTRRHKTTAPPGAPGSVPVLSTCHASNAPGLSADSQRMETGTT